jgi:hypothetical protein
MNQRSAFLVLGFSWTLFAIAGCQSIPSSSTDTSRGRAPVDAPSLGFFSKIKVPDDREPVLRLAARGAQVFRCEKRDNRGVWSFRQPDAELIDGSGKVIGRHGANFSFEHSDGSRLVATIAAHEEAPKPTDLRWLLLTTRSFGKGAFDGVTHVHRVNTAGGMPPAACEVAHAGRILRVDFSSDFVFYKPSAASAQ